jgi:flavorubredoxin
MQLLRSHDWAGGAVNAIQQELGLAGIDSKLGFKFVPDEAEIQQCVDFGMEMAKRIK